MCISVQTCADGSGSASVRYQPILANRHIGLSGECPICHQAAEDVKHIFFECQPAIALWSRLGMLNHISAKSQYERSGSVVLEELLR